MPEHPPTKLTLHPGAVVAVCLTGAAIGTVLGLGAESLFMWFQSTFGGAPALLRAASALPDVVTIAGLGIAGLVGGLWIAAAWEAETLVCEVGADGIRTRLNKRTTWVDRTAISAAYVDRDELVLADASGRMLVAGKVDGVGPKRVGRMLAKAGYPWSDGGHPFEEEFVTFVEGRDDLGEPATGLIKARATALQDGKHGRARELRHQLSDAGVLVRDRRGEQQYVILDGGTTGSRPR